jgi:hypothetical protein
MFSPCDPPRMDTPTPPARRSLLIPRLVAVAFVGSIAVLAFASWDVARGRVPDTDAPMLLDVLNSPENRTCTRDLPELAAKHFPVGMSESAVRALVAASTVKPPRPWVWTPKVEDTLSPTAANGEITFVRTLRFTPFGNHHVNGIVTLADGKVAAAKLRVVCALG